MPDALRAVVILSALFSLVTLVALIFKTLSFGRKPFYSKDSGSRLAGVVYIFGKGMLPWEKESARKHPFTYTAGVLYHAGIFAGLITLFCGVFSATPPRVLLFILEAALAAGAACGLALLLKRVLSPKLRKLSCPDDYAANALVTLFVILAAVSLRQRMPGPTVASSSLSSSLTTVDWAFYVVSIVVLLYIPVGKIRHCFFFFYSRALLGIFFGRRSALPTRPTSA